MKQIYNDDLVELERMVPMLFDELSHELSRKHKAQARRIKNILSNVRWNYGPHEVIEDVGELDDQVQ